MYIVMMMKKKQNTKKKQKNPRNLPETNLSKKNLYLHFLSLHVKGNEFHFGGRPR